MAVSKGPKQITIFGRLSFPMFTAQEAYDRSQKGQFPAKDVAAVKPDFSLLVTQSEWDQIKKHMQEEFLPYCAEQFKVGGTKAKHALDPKEIKALSDGLDDLTTQMYNSPAKPVHEKTQDLAPEAVASIKCLGSAGVDIVVKAMVTDESELKKPDPTQIKYPCTKRIEETVFSIYPGAYCGATLDYYSYHNGKHPGFSAGVSAIVFKADMDRFGGGVDVDEEAMFLD